MSKKKVVISLAQPQPHFKLKPNSKLVMHSRRNGQHSKGCLLLAHSRVWSSDVLIDIIWCDFWEFKPKKKKKSCAQWNISRSWVQLNWLTYDCFNYINWENQHESVILMQISPTGSDAIDSMTYAILKKHTKQLCLLFHGRTYTFITNITSLEIGKWMLQQT